MRSPISSFPETRWTPRHRNRRSRLNRAAAWVVVVCVVVGGAVLAVAA